MKYVIRKVPERDTTYLERLIPGALIFSDVLHIGPIGAFIEAMKMVQDDAVYIQDDMLLCKNFKERCDEICDKHKNEVVQLSNNTYVSDKTRVLVDGYYHPRLVPWALCIYIPYRIARLFVDAYESGALVANKFEERGQADDWMFKKFMCTINEDEYLVVPNLAGHPINKSTVLDSRDNQIRLCMNFEYDKAVPNGDISREIKHYLKNKSKFDMLRKEQMRGVGL